MSSRNWKDWLYEHRSRLMLYARQQTRTEADAEDVLQNAILKSWKTQEGKIDDGTLALVYANIRRCAIDQARSNQRRVIREEKAVAEAGEPVSWFELPEDDESRRLQVALSNIPEKYREVISLKIWGDLTFAQIGDSLNISPNTAASRYRYGLAALKTRLEMEPAEY